MNLRLIVLFSALIIIFLASEQNAYAVSVLWDFAHHDIRDGNVDPTLTSSVNQFTVSDPSLVGLGTINVKVNSTSLPEGITLTLTEDTGTPGSYTNTNLIFTNGTGTFEIGSTQTIGIHKQSLAGTGKIVSCPNCVNGIIVYSTTDQTGISMNLTETSSGVFTHSLKFTSGSSINGSAISVTAGDVVSIRDLSNHNVVNELVLPNSDHAMGAVQAKVNDKVCAVYGTSKDCTLLNLFTSPGGGGGGLIRPSLVLDIVSSVVGGSPYIVSPPSFGGRFHQYSDGLTLTQAGANSIFDMSKYNQEIPKQVMTKGGEISMSFKTYESYNVKGLIHMGLFVIPSGKDMISPNSISSVTWEKGKPTEVNDPSHILSDVSVSVNYDDIYQYTKFSFTPTKSYDKMSFLVRAWNDHRYTTDVRIHDANETQSPPKTLPDGVMRYDDFAELQEVLHKDQFYRPNITSHIHDTKAVFPNSEGGKVYWLYDTTDHSVTLVISDENANELFSYKSLLQPYEIEKKGDYKFMYFTVQQLNRWDVDQIQKAMKIEEYKAMTTQIAMKITRDSKW